MFLIKVKSQCSFAQCLFAIKCLTHVGIDPVSEISNTGVNSWVVSIRAPNAPRYDGDLSVWGEVGSWAGD